MNFSVTVMGMNSDYGPFAPRKVSGGPTPLCERDTRMTSTSEATGTTQISAGTWAIDPVHSSIGFSVRHLMVSKVRGNFESFSGEIVVAEDGTPSVKAEIAVDSIHTNNEQRDAHIKSADFFEVDKYPTATFRS